MPKLDEEYNAKAEELKTVLINKLTSLIGNRTSQGVKDFLGVDIIPKGEKFTAAVLREINFDTVNLSKWTTDAHKNDLIRRTIVNYLRKAKELDTQLRRRKFDLTIGDDLPSGIMQIAKVYIAKKRKSAWETRWPAVTATRVSCLASCARRTCRSSKTALRWISASTPWVYLRV